MRQLTALIIGLLTASALAYVPSAPIQWMNRVVMLDSPAGPLSGSNAPQQLLMKDPPNKMFRDSVPYFTFNSDRTIMLEGTSSCIEAATANSGHVVRLNRCTGEPTQTWNWIPANHGGNHIQLKDTDKCLDASFEGGFNGAPIVLRDCDSKGSGAWRFEETVLPPKRGWYTMTNLITLAGIAALSLGTLLRQYTGPRKLVPIPGGATSSVDEGGICLNLPLAVQMTSSQNNKSQRHENVPERTEIYPKDPNRRQPVILHPVKFAEYVAKRGTVSSSSSQRSGEASMSAAISSKQGNTQSFPSVKDLEHELLECSRSSWSAGRFGSGDRYANGQESCMDVVERLEAQYQDRDLKMSDLHGRWRLIFTNDSVTRSSPFFWVLKQIFGPLSKAYFASLDRFLYAPMAIGEAYQTVTDNELISEVELKTATGSFVMTTTSHLKSLRGRTLELTMETTQAKNSEWDDILPSFAQFGDIKFPSGLMFTGFNTVRADVTFLSDEFRVTRHQNNAYVYRKIK